MKTFVRVVILLIFSVTVACGKTKETYVLESPAITFAFKFQGYVVDNGDGHWIYYLNGDSNGIPIRHDEDLMVPDNLFICPPEMQVDAQKGKINYSLSIHAEAKYPNRMANEWTMLAAMYPSAKPSDKSNGGRMASIRRIARTNDRFLIIGEGASTIALVS